jgi:hypothetical protein
MGGAFGRGAILFCALIGCTTVALADQEPPATQPPAEGVDKTQPPLLHEDYYAIPETNLRSGPQAAQHPANWNGDIFETVPVPELFRQRLVQHGEFVQPFLQPAVFPEISARLLNAGAYAPHTDSGQFEQFLYLSAYFFDLYAPLLNIQDNVPVSADRMRMDLKLPLFFGNSVVTLYLSGNIPVSGVWTQGGGISSMLGYAIGSPDISLQIRVGGGYDQLVGETQAPLATSILGEAALSLALTPHIHLLLEADGRKLIGQPGGTLRAFPGFRFTPLALATLSFAVGALWVGNSFNADGHYIGGLGTQSVGAYLDFGYVFF